MNNSRFQRIRPKDWAGDNPPTGSVIYDRFEDVDEYLNFLVECKWYPCWDREFKFLDRDGRDCRILHSDEIRPKFFGSHSLEETLQHLRLDWPEGKRTYRKFAREIDVEFNMPDNKRNFIDTGMAGAFPIVPLYCAGEQEHMGIIKPNDTPAIVCLKAGLWVHVGVEVKEIMLWGLALTRAIDLLESQGIRVELIGSWYSSIVSSVREAKANELCLDVVLKKAEEPLDLEKIMFFVAHPSACRRFSFGYVETLPFVQPSHGGQQSAPRYTKAEEANNVRNLRTMVTVSYRQRSTLEDCFNYIVEELELSQFIQEERR